MSRAALALIDGVACLSKLVKTPIAFASNACWVSTCIQKCNVSKMSSLNSIFNVINDKALKWLI